ncbi:MAG: large conductance mechanosensitive channel protein MscL [Chloroflexi bacterium OHK40]
MLKGFRDFLLRGNVVDLAVAVIIGAAFNEVVNGFIAAFIDPLLAIALGASGAENLATVTVGVFPVGLFLSALITFVIKAFVIYFFVVRPFSGLAARFTADSTPAAPTSEEKLLGEIRDLLKAQRT